VLHHRLHTFFAGPRSAKLSFSPPKWANFPMVRPVALRMALVRTTVVYLLPSPSTSSTLSGTAQKVVGEDAVAEVTSYPSKVATRGQLERSFFQPKIFFEPACTPMKTLLILILKSILAMSPTPPQCHLFTFKHLNTINYTTTWPLVGIKRCFLKRTQMALTPQVAPRQ
jgi:hypothetical protein